MFLWIEIILICIDMYEVVGEKAEDGGTKHVRLVGLENMLLTCNFTWSLLLNRHDNELVLTKRLPLTVIVVDLVRGPDVGSIDVTIGSGTYE